MSQSFASTDFDIADLCSRRQWPEPSYQILSDPYSGGYKCIVRVNNREYITEKPFTDLQLARENAAMRAYIICRDESQFLKRGRREQQVDGIFQGRPVAIGHGRPRPTSDGGESSFGSQSSTSGDSSLDYGVDSSPTSYDDPRASQYSSSSNGSATVSAGRVLTYGQPVDPRYYYGSRTRY
ncbi:hypothetical protein MMC25_007050 [Agyrium rufum]|nr:hypothetical protein [Agyrium rufum]